MINILILLLLASPSYAVHEHDTAVATLVYIQPSLSKDQASKIAYSLLKSAYKYGLDWKIMAAIVYQESSFWKDSQHCLTKRIHCSDLGIGQINFKTWKDRLNLNRKRLLVDIDYNIDTMAQILSLIRDKYGKEKRWFTRYHSSTYYYRNIYYSLVSCHYSRIRGYSKGYQMEVNSVFSKR